MNAVNPYNQDFDYLSFHADRFSYLAKLGQKYFHPGDKFLDIGSLFGAVCFDFKALGYQSYGLDLEKYVTEFSDYFKQQGVDNRACNLETEAIPFPDNEFALIMASEVVEHFRFHPSKFFSEAQRVLKPGGRLIITTPNLIRLNNVLKLIIGRSINWDITDKYWDGAHVREFTASELIYVADKLGFKVERIEYKNFSYPNISAPVKLLNKIFGFLFPARRGNLVMIFKK